MNNKELLELAAKAAGVEGTWKCNSASGYSGIDVNDPDSIYWNPLEDDGDAFRLAVKLNLSLSQSPFQDAQVQGDYGSCIEAHDGDPYAATRLAIVRAAADIGKTMV
ncbi:MAG: hypothetical protein Q7T78_16935 [Rhodoferax sp.]|nr:hypothetical protein [Rhodoferax sp.]